MNSKSVWRNLIHDAKERGCFHNAREDNSLAQAIARANIEFNQLDRPQNNSKWKVMTLLLCSFSLFSFSETWLCVCETALLQQRV